MSSPGIRPALSVAAVAIVVLIAAAATRSPSGEAAPRPKVAGPRAIPPAEPRPAAVPRYSESPKQPERTRTEQKLALRTAASLATRDEKLVLVRDLLAGSDASLKSRALSVLRGLPGPEAAALAVGVLRKDGPSWLRAQAASVLAELGDPTAVPSLLDAARSEEWDVRAGAAAALDRFGHSGPLRELIGGLVEMLDHPDGGKREDAVFLLSSLQTPATLPGLLKALGDPTNSKIREAAADALGRSRLPEAIPSLEAAAADPDANVREAARAAIESLRKSR